MKLVARQLKMWILSEEKNRVQMIQLDLLSLRQSLGSEMAFSCMDPLLLIGDMLFIRSRLSEEDKIIVYDVKDQSCQLLAYYPANHASEFRAYRPTLFSCEFR
ncbi:hypothetical protein AMTR_s00008p00232370 [Amborella trichopoda]|uniref:DUF295 domain-containing protein n=1 Tax=Amborella trichopoda TaxID=13333 RepID=W1NIW3_AMBTC|nr:hypothetical protein AMTR_s00008p00232370 [Amborella trichopoda]